MADEAFALSPISARAALPSEGDYEAISQAFMETSRGRWFLGEYAKRNRNADTSMVLDAVARIEEAIAAQRQPAPEKYCPEKSAWQRGPEATEPQARAQWRRWQPTRRLLPASEGPRFRVHSCRRETPRSIHRPYRPDGAPR